MIKSEIPGFCTDQLNTKTTSEYPCSDGPDSGVSIPRGELRRVYVSRQCAICEEVEFPACEAITQELWICPECAKKIGKLIGVRTDG